MSSLRLVSLCFGAAMLAAPVGAQTPLDLTLDADAFITAAKTKKTKQLTPLFAAWVQQRSLVGRESRSTVGALQDAGYSCVRFRPDQNKAPDPYELISCRKTSAKAARNKQLVVEFETTDGRISAAAGCAADKLSRAMQPFPGMDVPTLSCGLGEGRWLTPGSVNNEG